MKAKIIFIIALTLFAFLNNLLFAFDQVQNLTFATDITAFFRIVDSRVESTESFGVLLYRYFIFFIFFFNITDVRSILKTYQL